MVGLCQRQFGESARSSLVGQLHIGALLLAGMRGRLALGNFVRLNQAVDLGQSGGLSPVWIGSPKNCLGGPCARTCGRGH